MIMKEANIILKYLYFVLVIGLSLILLKAFSVLTISWWLVTFPIWGSAIMLVCLIVGIVVFFKVKIDT